MRRRLGSDFYLHALPPVHRGNSLLYDYLTGHTCGKGQVRVCLDPRQVFNDMLNYRSIVFSTCDVLYR